MSPAVRPAAESDLAALTRHDLTYPTGRVLAIERLGNPPEHTFSLRWRDRSAPDAVYNEYTEEFLWWALCTAPTSSS